jgi:hypothetical protein
LKRERAALRWQPILGPGAALVAELRLPPGPLDRILGQLLEAEAGNADDLAACLGLESPQLARSLRRLTANGAVDRSPDRTLALTPDGRAWLAVQPLAVEESPPATVPKSIAAPPLQPLRLSAEMALLRREWLPTDDQDEPQPRRWRLNAARLPLKLPRLQLPALGTRRVPPVLRGTGVAVVATIVLLATVQSGLPAQAVAGLAPPAVAHDEPATPIPPPVPTTPPPPSPMPAPREAWRLVAHTDGLGLVLRPAPAASTRIRNLPEGTRVRVTGAAVSRAGHAWLPVETATGQTGWAAAEYLVEG